jgi:AcrR family transcriptional regulator
MAARNVSQTPPKADGAKPSTVSAGARQHKGRADRYRPLPTGTHGLDPELVKRDQRERLQKAMIELIGEKGYPGVRIVDLAKLAHVSQPTFYSLYADKEDLFLSAYDEVAEQAARVVIAAYAADGSADERLVAAMRAFGELAAAEPDTTSLLVLGAFGAGGGALERRKRAVGALERSMYAGRDGAPTDEPTDLTVKFIIGGIREVAATRLRSGHADELPALAEELARWAACYRRRLPEDLEAAPAARRSAAETSAPSAPGALRGGCRAGAAICRGS